MRIMIADDAAFIREIIAQVCEEQGHTVCGMASNGQEAVNLFKSVAPEIVFMDLVMPEMNGIVAAHKILELNPNTKIIACSTIDQKEYIKKSTEAGCVAYLAKPFTKIQIIETLNKLHQVTQSAGGNYV